MPEFEPLYINDWDDHGLLNLPYCVDLYNPFKLFNLFFIEEVIDKLVEWINKHAELYLLDKEIEYLRVWQPIYKEELYAYIGVLIYIGITIESCIKDYWRDLNTYGTEYIIKEYILVVRFQQLNRHF